MKILFIDDDLLLLEMYNKKFTMAGYEVITASNGKDGVKKAREKKPNLIITDIVMPSEDGYFVIEKIKNDKNLQNIPIIAISGLTSSHDRNEAMRLGAVEYIIKTDLSPSQLLKKAEDVLKKV